MLGLDSVIQIISSFVGTLGFCILFNIRGKKLVLASVGGAVAWFCFLLFNTLFGKEILCYLLVSIIASIYSEIMARVIKTPVTTFSIAVLIPLIPGSALYYSLKFALEGNTGDFVSKASYTLSLAAALSVGIIIVNTVARHINMKKFIKLKK